MPYYHSTSSTFAPHISTASLHIFVFFISLHKIFTPHHLFHPIPLPPSLHIFASFISHFYVHCSTSPRSLFHVFTSLIPHLHLLHSVFISILCPHHLSHFTLPPPSPHISFTPAPLPLHIISPTSFFTSSLPLQSSTSFAPHLPYSIFTPSPHHLPHSMRPSPPLISFTPSPHHLSHSMFPSPPLLVSFTPRQQPHTTPPPSPSVQEQ